MSKGKSPVMLVFGENDNDRETIRQFLMALIQEPPRIEKRVRPLVLVKGRENAKARKNAMDIAKVVAADRKRFNVRIIFAHEDCDAIEPAHEDLAERIERELRNQGVTAIAVTPAWEMEAWWFLWPEAVAAVNGKWRRLARCGQHVGLIENAKEVLRRELRPHSKGKPPRDYEESDSPKIAQKVRELDLIDQRDAISFSFDRFEEQVRKIRF